METKTNDQLEKVKSAAQRRFEQSKMTAKELQARCTAIEIKDASTLAMANQLLSEMNDCLKSAKAKGLEMRKPYNDAVKEIISMEKLITEPLEAGIELGKTKLREWNTKQKELQAKADEENNKKFTFLKTIQSQLDEKIKLCLSSDQCHKLIESIQEKFPAFDQFGQYAEDAKKVKANYIVLLTTRKQALESSVKADASPEDVASKVEESNKVAEQIQEQQVQIVEKKEVIAADNVAITSKVRRSWKFEVVNEDALPKQFLSVDDKKIRAYLSSKKEDFAVMAKNNTTEKVIGGVRFYYDESPQI